MVLYVIKEDGVLEIFTLYPRSFGSNCYVLLSEGNGEKHAAVIDPSVDCNEIITLISTKGAKLEKIVLTHGHFDHILSLDTLRALTGAPAYIHESDAEMLFDGNKNAYAFFFSEDKKWMAAEELLHDGDEISVGDEKLKVISTPGHSKGSICLLGDGFMITGDTLFADNIGRCDLYGGNMMQMYASLSKLSEFDPKLKIYPGHGDTSTLSHALSGLIR